MTRELLGNYWRITGELFGNYWGINIICISGIERIVFELTSPSLLNLYFVASVLSIRRRKETSKGNIQ